MRQQQMKQFKLQQVQTPHHSAPIQYETMLSRRVLPVRQLSNLV
jgi:hypothetical protein